MFLVIPLVEFLHVLGVDINVHHENPATFLCHMSVSSVKRSRHRFASSRWHPVLSPEPRTPGETRDTNWGAILAHGATRNIMGRKCPWPFPQPATRRVERAVPLTARTMSGSATSIVVA